MISTIIEKGVAYYMYVKASVNGEKYHLNYDGNNTITSLNNIDYFKYVKILYF